VLSPATVESVDAVILLTAHSGLDYDMLVTHAPIVLDTQNRLKDKRASNVFPL
jgi:UDP-N-acetyl-D-mannosaminuronate dehydrogenase